MAETEQTAPDVAEDPVLRIPEIIPALPLRDLVIYPTMIVPLFVGRDKSVLAVEEALGKEMPLLLLTQRSATVDEPGPEDLYTIGTAAESLQPLRLPGPEKMVRVVMEGLARVRVIEFVQTEPFYLARIEVLSEKVEPDVETEALTRSVISQFEKCIDLGKTIPQEAVETARQVKDPGRLADLIASHLNVKVEAKQALLEELDVKKRLEQLADLLNKEIEILEVERKIHSRVRKELEETQKEFYLRERMKAIQQELGERDERAAEMDELREQIAAAKMPTEVEEKALKELDRLEKMPAASPEVTVVRTHLDWMVSLPWAKHGEDKIDIRAAERVLNEDHYGLGKVKERILEFLAVRKLRATSRGPILCFVGPPGVGKTSIGRSIARAIGRKFVRISLGGVRDEGEIRGHRRTYVGAMPGRIIQGMKTAAENNPVFMMDEIDKIGVDFRGDPSAALLEVLDPEQNFAFSDHYLEAPFDLSRVMFITTANQLDPIPPALHDRMEVIEFPGYSEEEKLKIAELFLVRKQLYENGLEKGQLSFTEAGIRQIIRHHTREAGVRNLEREVGSICRKVAKGVAGGKVKSARVTAKTIEKYLGPIRYRYGTAETKDEIAVATGLGWTPVGGDVMPVEVTLMKGKGALILTGQLGDVMQESAKAALSFARSRAKQLGIDEDFYQVTDVHIHVPAGQVPKDGPSAGITLATALISALTKIPVRKDVAMTGEITLRGKVLPVGGIKEKVLAAHRAGNRVIIMPRDNERDLDEIPAHVRKELDFRFVDHIDQVLKVALRRPSPEGTRTTAKKE